MISPPGDEDWYSVTIPTPLRLRIGTLPPILGTGPIADIEDSTLELLDSQGNSLAYDDIDGPSLHSELSLDLPAGTYTIIVGGFQGLVVGGYQLFVDCEAPFASATEGAEPNGDPGATPAGTPTPIGCDTVAQGAISISMDEDWFQLDVTRATLVIVTTGDPAGTSMPIFDTVMDLLDASGAVLDTSDDAFYGTLYSRVERVLPPGRYYAAVRGYQTATGGYSLQVECIDGFAGLLLHGTGCTGSNGIPTIFERVSPGFGETFEAPVIGSTFSIDAAGLPSNSVTVGLAGLSNTTYGGASLPFDLALLGAGGCRLQTSVEISIPLPTDASGQTLWALEVPYDPAIVGGTVYLQLFTPDAGAPGGLTVSNLAEAVVGTRVRWVQRLFP